jgi:hypothetical protein
VAAVETDLKASPTEDLLHLARDLHQILLRHRFSGSIDATKTGRSRGPAVEGV